MKIIHYSRSGYNGNYTYTSVCGKKVKTHQENETSSIHPEEANCKKCLMTDEHDIDLRDSTGKNSYDIKRRIYLESDILQANEFRTAQMTVFDLAEQAGLKCVDRVFSQVLDRAWHDLAKTWKAVKDADEIYATSSLMPLSGGSYMGAPVIFNGMMERAIKEKVTGKSVIILNAFKNINWYMIKVPMMKDAFKNNKLFMYDDDYDLIEITNSMISKIKK